MTRYVKTVNCFYRHVLCSNSDSEDGGRRFPPRRVRYYTVSQIIKNKTWTLTIQNYQRDAPNIIYSSNINIITLLDE